VKRWVDAMTADNLSKTTQGIYLRACRLVVYRCIGEGHLLPKANMFAKGKDKVKIPNGNSRKGCYLSIGQMTDLYDHLINRDLNLPIYDQRLGRNNPKNYVKSKKNLEYIYQALAMFLMQYLACGCNLFDLALLRYDNYYFDSNRRAFRFIRRKSQDETLDGEGMEVVVPITKEMQAILNLYAAKPEHNQLVFPFLMGDAITGSAQNQYDKVHQENKNIADRMKKVAACLEWTINPTGTYARHSFATNLHAAKVPMEYISDAMGHSLGNTGQITKRYISAYTVEERLAYNNKLLDKPAYNSRTSSDATERIDNAGQPMSETRQKLMNIINSYSDETLRSMIIEKRNREMTDLGLG
jgi:Phage integrase family.